MIIKYKGYNIKIYKRKIWFKSKLKILWHLIKYGKIKLKEDKNIISNKNHMVMLIILIILNAINNNIVVWSNKKILYG